MCVCVGGGTFLITIEGSGGMPPPIQKFFLVFSCSETASGAI